MRGDDITAITHQDDGRLQLLKGEAKSRARLTKTTVNEAAAALDRYRGRPARHSVIFVASRLRERGDDALAGELEEALLDSFSGVAIEHLLATVSANSADKMLTDLLVSRRRRPRTLHAAGVQLENHADVISSVFEGM